MTFRQGHTPGECIFCRIASGEVEAHEVFRSERIMAFLDDGPIRDGHVQIIPVAHFETFEVLPPEVGAEILTLAQRIARVQKRLYKVQRVAFLFTGGDVPHAHAHVIPMVEKTDVTSRRYIRERALTWQSLPRPESARMREIAAELAHGLAGDFGQT